MLEQKPNIRNKVILIAIAVSVLLYFAGVMSGLYANKILKQETEQDLTQLEQRTKEDLQNLKIETTQYMTGMSAYIDFLDANLRNLQLQQAFVDTLESGDKCEFLQISMNELISKLHFYWERLPYRIEEYELTAEPTEEYLLLKEQYTQISLQVWALAKKLNEQCNVDIIYGLHFYSPDCTQCVRQGEQLDIFNELARKKGKDVILFPVDYNSDDIIVKNIKTFYGINTTPSLIINNRVYQGRVFEAKELFK